MRDWSSDVCSSDLLAELSSFEMTHAEFSAAIWPDLTESARGEKFCKWLYKLREDMELSNCFPVKISKPRYARHEDGSFKTLPTLFQFGIFWILFRAVQDAALESDLMQLEPKRRRAKVRAIVKKWLDKNEAVQAVRQKKDEKEIKPSLPCRCACALCVQCLAKGNATASEAVGAELLRHEPNEDFGAELDRFAS